jgi:hypothetical protein
LSTPPKKIDAEKSQVLKAAQSPKTAQLQKTGQVPKAAPRKKSFLRQHSLSISAIAIMLCWVLLYIKSDPSTHWGSFFGNAIADWSGVVVTVLATKYLYEKQSAESRRPPNYECSPTHAFFRDHGLSIFLIITGIAWVVAFIKMDPNAKWGQVVGNIVSEWTQIFGLVILTKHFMEKNSKESSR